MRFERITKLFHSEGILSFGSGDMFNPEAIAYALENYFIDGVLVARRGDW